MTKNCLSEEEAKAIFMDGAKSAMPEKQAQIGDVLGGLWNAAKGSAGLIRDLGIYGALGGALTGAGYNIIKDRITAPSPEDEFNHKVERIVTNHKRELEDAKWMDRVRGMRDELARNYKKMTPEEYAKKYNALVAALDERRA